MRRIFVGVVLFMAVAAWTADEPAPAVVQEATATITIDKQLYERLLADNKRLEEENRTLKAKYRRLLLEFERLTAELAIWRSRLERVLQCESIQEAIEELRAVLGINQGGGESQVPPAQR